LFNHYIDYIQRGLYHKISITSDLNSESMWLYRRPKKWS